MMNAWCPTMRRYRSLMADFAFYELKVHTDASTNTNPTLFYSILLKSVLLLVKVVFNSSFVVFIMIYSKSFIISISIYSGLDY